MQRQPRPIAAADAIVCINMVHVAPWAVTQALFDGARQVLAPASLLFLYGPYRRGGRHTAPHNAKLDADLCAHDSDWGVRDVEARERVANQAGIPLAEIVAMPENNFSLVFRKSHAMPG